MYEDYENSGHACQTGGQRQSSVTAESDHSDRHTIDRGQFRTDQVQVLNQQVQVELTVSLLLSAIVIYVFRGVAPNALLLGWAVTVVLSVGIRCLYLSARKPASSDDGLDLWGQQYITGVTLSGMSWGSLGIIAAIYANLQLQIFTLVILAGMSLTAFVSMQSSPKTISAFVIPAMLPVTSWLAYQGTSLSLAMAAVTAIFTAVMLFSSRTMREALSKSSSLGSHNTDLIKQLVNTREAAESSKKYADDMNARLHEQMLLSEQAEERSRKSENRMSAIFDSIQDTIYQTDILGQIQWTTPSIKQLLGYEPDELIGQNIKDFYYCNNEHDDLKKALDANHGRLQHFETCLLHKDGSHVWISENSHYKYDENGDPIGIEGTIRDITALKQAKEALHQEKERAQVTLGSIGDGVITTDLQGNIEYMNTVAEQSTGWKLPDARGKTMIEVLKLVEEKSLETPPDPAALCLGQGKSTMLSGHLLLIHRYRNQRLSVEVNASPIRDSKSDITGVVLVFHDVTELRGLARKMSYQATHDPLTGLLNRREFENRIKAAINNSRDDDVKHALCYVDLDNFKVVNDTSGHFAGDELLKQLTIKLRTEMRESDTLARLGGDEFGILLEGCSIENAHEPAEMIRKVVENFRFVWDNTSFRVGASIGLVPITSNSGTLSDLLSAADSACYIAKEQGRNRVHIYEPNDEAVSERHGQMQWVQRIQRVLEEDRFRLFYQPIARLSNNPDEANGTHGEVLLRMLDDNDKIVGPGSFIPAAERYQLMPSIDRWVVSNTLKILANNLERVIRQVSSCCINLSGQSLSDERFMAYLVDEIRNSGVPPELLVFEITETAVIANLCNASTLISTLREMGCRFALDDFGVGLSSFGYLKTLAVDYLKLDGCFVKNMVDDNIDHAMVQAINQIGHTMNIKTIAEFVEDEATLEAVRKVGVDYAQGYVIAKPAPIEIALFNKPICYDRLVDQQDTAALQSVAAKR